MKNILYIIIAITVTFSTNAQVKSKYTKNIKWQELEIPRKSPAPIVLGKTNKDLLIISTKKKKKYLEKYSLGSLALKSSTPLTFKFRKKTLKFVYSYMVGDTPIILTSFFNKKTRKNYLFYHVVDTKRMVMKDPKVLAYKSFPKTKGRKNKKSKYQMSNDFNDITSVVSEDKELSFLSFPNPEKAPKIKGEQNRFFLGKLFDDNYKQIEDFNFKIPFEYFQIRETKIGTNGFAAFLIDELVKNSDPKAKKRNRDKMFIKQRYLMFVDVETGELETIALELESDNISKISLALLKNGGVAVRGLTAKEDYNGVSGAFSIVFDKDLIEVNNVVKRFDSEFLTATWSDRVKRKIKKRNKKRAKKGKKKIVPQFYNYYIDHVIELSDGSVTMLAEQYYVRVVTHSSTVNGVTTTTTTYYYYYNDIIAVNFDKNGEFSWEKKIKKHQVSTNDGGYYSSYFVVRNDDELDIIYNEGKVAVKVNLSAEGQTKKENIIQFTDERRMRLVPKICGKLDDNSIFLYATSRKKSKIGVLRY